MDSSHTHILITPIRAPRQEETAGLTTRMSIYSQTHLPKPWQTPVRCRLDHRRSRQHRDQQRGRTERPSRVQRPDPALRHHPRRSNEYGAMAAAKLFGIEILNEGTGHSIDVTTR